MQPIGGNVPALGDAGYRMEVNRILGDESLEQCRDDINLGNVGRKMGIEITNLTTDATVQYLIPIAVLYGGFAPDAGRKEQ